MKSLGRMLLERQSFKEIVIGNTALVRAMVEAHVAVITSYPGSPTPEIADAIASIPGEERPFYFEYSTNEKVATEVAFGASIGGRLSVVFFKSVGLNVAADSFVQLSLMNLIGGMVIILGDDPGANSSQNEQDNRHYGKMTKIPIWEPGSPQEAYGMFLEAAQFSKENQMPVILRLTTHVCHGKERVSFGSWNPQKPMKGSAFDPENGPYIPLAKMALDMKRISLEKLEKVKRHSNKSDFNKISNRGSKRGVIVCGLPSLSLEDILGEVESPPDVLKIAMPYPIPEEIIIDFLRGKEEVKILEELDPIIETDVKALAFDNKISCLIHGKGTMDEWIGEYTPSKVRAILRSTWSDLGIGTVEDVSIVTSPLSPRPPQMCPGCGHRSAFYALKKVLKETDITVADIGCHTLGYLSPYNVGQVLVSMGHSNGTGAGLSLGGHERRIITFLGDSTFFHAGLPGIINAITNQHNITLVVMKNDTTAMTGHQNHPGSPGGISIKSVLEGFGVDFIRQVDTYKQDELASLFKQALDHPRFSVIIADHPCMLKFTREQKRKGRAGKALAMVNQEKCERLVHCIEKFACPSFHKNSDGSISVSADLCIGDGSCVQTCPATAISLKRLGQSGGQNE